jgi:hypothetical protein
MSYPNPLNDRVNFKLNAASIHLDNLRRLEANSQAKSLASSDVRVQAEMEIDEFLYHLIGVKDALLQEINCRLHLSLARKEVMIEAINKELNQKREVAKDITTEICNILSNEKDPLWLANELHNYSKHRAMLVGEIVNVDGRISSFVLIDPRTNKPMRDDKGNKIPIIRYLEDSFTSIEALQKTVREKIDSINYWYAIRSLDG